jgi:hypothetical protein
MAPLLPMTVTVIYWFITWGLLSHLVDYLTSGNTIKEIIFYLVIFIILSIFYFAHPDLLNHV